MDSNYKTAPIAIGHKPDLLFNMAVMRRKASDPEIIEAVFHLKECGQKQRRAGYQTIIIISP